MIKIDIILKKVLILKEILIKYNYKLSTTESCTAGLLSYFLTSQSGASIFFNSAIVVYNDEAKINLLNVSRDSLIKFTAVSEEICKEMAINCQKLTGSDLVISVTGYADYYNNVEKNGFVFIGAKFLDNDVIIRRDLYYDGREANRIAVVLNSLELIETLLNLQNLH